MTLTYFTNEQLFLLALSLIVLIASTFTFHLNRIRLALTFLFVGSLGLGFFIAGLDNFLMLWDEQYHALVAKHMMENRLKPTLYSTPLLEYDYRNWTANHIWLHKQPLFLWQIALSLKTFGINELAVRIPSIILHAVAAPMIYRIGKISYNARVGFYGALFFSVAYYLLELVVGKYPTDHNDVSFMFYVTASIWAWFEYKNSQKRYWLVLIGIFSGGAVLVKWLVGLLIYAVWGITLGVTDKKKWLQLTSYLPLLTSFAVSLVVFIPWQLYILFNYPAEAAHEFQLNTDHFFRVIEGHDGDIWFHFNAISDIYGAGDAVPFLLLIGLFLYLKNATTTIYRVAILSAVIITYGFYSMAATKMISFCVIVAPFGFLALGALTDGLLSFLHAKIKSKKFEVFFRSMVVLGLCFFLLNLSKVQQYHTDWKPMDNNNRNAEYEQMAVIEKLNNTLKEGNHAVFNANKRFGGNIAIMFYTNCVAYDFIPSLAEINNVKMQSYKVVILDTGNLPNFIIEDDEIIKIK